MNGSPAIRTALSEFKIARYLDKPNERFPSGKHNPTPINKAFYLKTMGGVGGLNK